MGEAKNIYFTCLNEIQEKLKLLKKERKKRKKTTVGLSDLL